MPNVLIECPECERAYEVDAEVLGQRILCRKCNQRITARVVAKETAVDPVAVTRPSRRAVSWEGLTVIRVIAWLFALACVLFAALAVLSAETPDSLLSKEAATALTKDPQNLARAIQAGAQTVKAETCAILAVIFAWAVDKVTRAAEHGS